MNCRAELVVRGLRQPLEVAHQHAAADGELGEEDVHDAEAADHQALHHRAEVVDRVEVVHGG